MIHEKELLGPGERWPDAELPLLYRAAVRGLFGSRRDFDRGSITDALFVYLDGEPGPVAAVVLDEEYMARPWVCLTGDWENYVRTRYPQAMVFRRYLMAPARRFRIPEKRALPPGCRLAPMDEKAFDLHPFSHGRNYPSYAAFRAEGSGAVVYRESGIVASASSFLSMDGEVELDVSTKEEHRGQGLAAACISRMLEDCMGRGLTVHWDAQNEISRHLAEKFGFDLEKTYPVYYVPETESGARPTAGPEEGE